MKNKIALFLEKEHELIVEKYLEKYKDKNIIEIGVATPRDERDALERWLYKKSIAPNLIGVDIGKVNRS